MKTRPALSLKGRALGLLSRREHSRVELSKKLTPHAESAEQLSQVLDELERLKYLSDERFVASLVHRKSAKHGLLKIKHELHSHKLAPELVAGAIAEVKAGEFENAFAVWDRKFGVIGQTPQDKAKQMRFLASRGFSGEVIRRVFAKANSRASFDGTEDIHEDTS